MSETRMFHLGDILTFTTGMLLSPRHMDGVYDLATYMLGRPVFTHEMPAAFREIRPVLLAQHPHLAAIEMPEFTPAMVPPWVEAQAARFGEMLAVQPVTWSALAEKSPIETAVEAFGEDRVIAVEVDR